MILERKMVSKWIANNPLTIEERSLIEEGIKLNLSYRQLALHVGRPRSTVMRESKRLGNVWKYSADKAQRDFERKQKNCGHKIK